MNGAFKNLINLGQLEKDLSANPQNSKKNLTIIEKEKNLILKKFLDFEKITWELILQQNVIRTYIIFKDINSKKLFLKLAKVGQDLVHFLTFEDA
jgi:hypothetical protein